MATVISVRFRSGSKTYYFDPRELTVHPGDDVVVETAQGAEFAQCVEGNHDVADEAVVKPLRPVLRIATDNDRHTAAYNRGSGKSGTCQPHIHRKHENIVKHNVKQASDNRCQHGP